MAADFSITVPGVKQVVEASLTFGHGITPSVAIVTTAVQKDFPAAGGTVEWKYKSIKFSFTNCKIDSISYQRGAQGIVWHLAILDRRWKWQFGKISGIYNRSQMDGKIDTKTEKKPSELAKLLLDAMNEQNYDVSAVPDDTRPDVAWDYDNPAQMLASLLDPLGCRIVLGLDDKVKIVKLGDGKPLPDGFVTDDAGTVDPPEKPDSLMLVGGIKLYQDQLKLEAVGRDLDGTVKKIDDLSYKPSSGWAKLPIQSDDWAKISAGTQPLQTADDRSPVSRNIQARKLASETVFRMYRVIGSRDGTMNIQGIKDTIPDIKQLFPLSNERVEQIKEPLYENRKVNLPARVLGKFYLFGSAGINSDKLGTVSSESGRTADLRAGEDLEYQGGFSIDNEHGLVIFSQPMALYDSALGGWKPAEIWLETSFGLRDFKTRGLQRYERESKFNSNPPAKTGPRIYRDDGYLRTSYATYDATGKFQKVTTNEDTINKQADDFLKQAKKEYETVQPGERSYAGLIRQDLDGAIQQITWSIGGGGAKTRISRNNEHNFNQPTYAEKRRLEKNKNGPEQLDKLRRSKIEPNQLPDGLIA